MCWNNSRLSVFKKKLDLNHSYEVKTYKCYVYSLLLFSRAINPICWRTYESRVFKGGNRISFLGFELKESPH